jgi:TolB protein
MQLTSGRSNCEDPTWAPNGWVIAYTSDRTGKKQVHTVFADGRSIAHLPTAPIAHSADWSPMLQ